MSSITTQQTKLDLELVPNENRLDIKKCNGRIPSGLTPREPTFQVVLDAIALTQCYPAFPITADVPEGKDFDALPSEEDIVSFLRELGHSGVINSLNDVVVDQMHQPCRTFAALINQCLSRKTSGLDKLRLSRDQILWGMYYQKNVDYVELLWEHFIYQIHNKVYKTPTMKESKAYKTFLGYATGVVPPKITRKLKKASPSKKDSNLVSIDEKPVTKGKRVKRSIKKSSTKPAIGIIIIKSHVETKSKRKEELDVTRGKGIDLLSEVALTEEAQMKEGNDEDNNNDDNDSENEGNDEENKSDDDKTPSESEKEVKDNDEEEDKIVHTPSNSDDDEDANPESKNNDKSEGDEDRGMDDMTNQFSDDVQDKEADTVAKETKVLYASFSHSSSLASKFLKFSDIDPNDGEIVSPLDVHVHHEVPRIHTSTLLTVPVLVIPEASSVCTTILQSSQTFTSTLKQLTPTPPLTIETTNIPSIILDFTLVFRFNERVIALEKDVGELKKDPLHTQVTALFDDHLDTRMGATKEEFMNFLSTSLTDKITEQVRN
nr:hypothetical protein [Tanacetum cinerariifolium]